MPTEYINRSLTPSDKGGSEGEEQDRIEKLLEYVRANFLVSQVFTDYEIGQYAEYLGYVLPDKTKNY
jgi:hypothetical protein